MVRREGRMPSDEELMTAYVRGDARAFRELFDRYAPLLFRVLRTQLRRPEDAHDLVQQAFLHLHRSRNDFREGARLRPWLFTIAFNLKREYFRRAARKPEKSLDAEGIEPPHVGPRGHEQAEATDEVEYALSRLPEDQREVIALHWLAGVPLPEVAVLVGASLAAVKVRAHRGYAAMRRALSPGNQDPR
jgi:RNA polymerase sigma-70 factor (ECF subfamily)